MATAHIRRRRRTVAPAAAGPGTLQPAQRLDRPAVAVAVMDEGDGIAREHLPA